MLTAVDLNREVCAAAIEIDDKIIYTALTVEFHRIAAQKVVPEMPFLRRHVFAQLAGAVFHGWIVACKWFFGHCTPPALRATSPCRGGEKRRANLPEAPLKGELSPQGD